MNSDVSVVIPIYNMQFGNASILEFQSRQPTQTLEQLHGEPPVRAGSP